MLTKLMRHLTVCDFIVNAITNEANIQVTKAHTNEKDYVKQHEITRFLKRSHNISTLDIPVSYARSKECNWDVTKCNHSCYPFMSPGRLVMSNGGHIHKTSRSFL